MLYGLDAIPPEDPTKEGYVFDGWNYPYTNIKGATYIFAKWKEIEQHYTVTFKDGDTVIGQSQQVLKGEDATPPANPTKEGYDFNGWDGTYTNVTSDRTITAKWAEKTIAPFNFDPNTTNISFPTTLNASLLNNIDPTLEVSRFSASDNVNALAYSSIVSGNLANQNANLIQGYQAAAAVYPGNTKFRDMVALEKAYRTLMVQAADARNYVTKVDGIINSMLLTILSNSSVDTAAFRNDFNAYRAGKYVVQLQRDNTLAAFGADFRSAFNNVTGLTNTPQYAHNGNGAMLNLDAVMSELQTRILNQINTAIGVNDITNTTDKGRVTDLNGYLLNQIGEDIMQYKGMVDDYSDIGFDNDVFQITRWNEIPTVSAADTGPGR